MLKNVVMETCSQYDDRKLKCSLEVNMLPAPAGALQYLDKNGYCLISSLFKPDEDFNLTETESILKNIFLCDYKIKSQINDIYFVNQNLELRPHDGMSLFIMISTNSLENAHISLNQSILPLYCNDAIFFDRNKVSFSTIPVKSRYNFLGRLMNKILFRRDDTFYQFVCIDYLKE